MGLIHRDIKPSNILLDDDGFAYLIDFGIARVTDDTRLTKTGNTIGTFAYIPPERLQPHTEEDARADIYSLACVLYEALTGEPPFPGSTTALMFAHAHTPPPRPSTTQPSVPARFDAVIAKGMAKDPDNRYATTVELADAAREAITEPFQRSTPSPAPYRPPPEPPASPVPTPPLSYDQRPQPPPSSWAREAVQHRPESPAYDAPQFAAGRASATRPRNHVAHRIAPPVVPPTRSRWSRWRLPIIVALVTLMLVAGLLVGWMVIHQNYYAADYDGKVTLMRGFPGGMLGISLQDPDSVACVDEHSKRQQIPFSQIGGQHTCQLLATKDLSPAGRQHLQSGFRGGNRDQALRELDNLLASDLLPLCTSLRPMTPSTTPSSTPSEQPHPSVTETQTSTQSTTASTSPSSHPNPQLTTTTAPSGNASPPVITPSEPSPNPGVECREAG